MRFKPVVLSVREESRYRLTFQWFSLSFYLTYTKGKHTFLQFGTSTAKFFFFKLSKKEKRTPLFLLTRAWKTPFATKRVRIGKTNQPLKLINIWGNYNVQQSQGVRKGRPALPLK